MKNITMLLCCICVMLSGCRNRNHNETSDSAKNDSPDFDKTYFLNFEQYLKNISEDTFTINSLAKNISFITLETSSKALLTTSDFKVIIINGRYFISSGTALTFSGIMEFDGAGRFMNYSIPKGGRGPKELPLTYEWSYNRDIQLLIASSLYEILSYSLENSTINKYSLGSPFFYVCPLNDGILVGANSIIGSGDVNMPYLHFRNQCGKIVHSLCYPQKRDIAYNLPEGRGPMETYQLYPSYSGDALFKDMFNDTIYRIRGIDDVVPYIIIHRGMLALTIKDVYNQATMAQKICIRGILDTKNYFFIKYWHKDAMNCAIWDKQSLTFITNIKADNSSDHRIVIFNRTSNGFTKYQTPNGKEILIAISSYFEGKLYSMLDASVAMEFLPNVKEDDNPVLMVIELK